MPQPHSPRLRSPPGTAVRALGFTLVNMPPLPMCRLSLFALLLLSPLPLWAQKQPLQPRTVGHAMVVSIHHDASDAGLEILRAGGNAVDAAVATGFALAVVLPQAGNLGGGGFMLVRDHTGAAHFLDFRERAPMAATANMYLDAQGNVVPGLSTVGYKAIGVPGSVAGLAYAQAHYGKLTLKQDMAPAIRLARQGYVLSAEEARTLHNSTLTRFPESHRIFQRDGNFYQPGDTFTQPDLARTLERIAANPAEFYKGRMAAELATSVRTHGGLLTEADLLAYSVVERTPLTGEFHAHGHTYGVLTSPPPSSGGIALLEILNMISGLDLTAAGADRSEPQVHSSPRPSAARTWTGPTTWATRTTTRCRSRNWAARPTRRPGARRSTR